MFRRDSGYCLKEESVQVSKGFELLFEGGISPCLGGIQATI